MYFSSLVPKVISTGINKNFLRISRLTSTYLKNIQYKSLSNIPTNSFTKVQNNFHLVEANSSYTKVLKRFVSTSNESKTTTFQQMLNARKKQAHRSVLLELIKKDDIPYALSLCESYGKIKNAYSFSGISENVYLLLEFNEEECVQQLLNGAHFKNIADVFPVLSRIVGYTRKTEQSEPKVSVNVIESTPSASPIKEGTVSDLIEQIYNEEKLTELNVRLRFFFCCLLKEILSGPFPYCDAIPFGSSVNGIGRLGCDLDLVIRLYPENPDKNDSSSELYFVNKTCVGDIKNLQRRVLFCIGDWLRTFSPGITTVHKILHARVPIVKLDHKILGMQVDISVNNFSPILMSEILYFCGEVDSRIRPLLYAVKKWAKEGLITHETPGSQFTNFALTLLVVYFLQNRHSPILPPFIEFMKIIGADCTKEYRVEFIKTLPELQAKASFNKESLAILLLEFLKFIGSYPFENKHISLLTGSATERESEFPVWIQYPIEEDFNVSKNVSVYELQDTCDKARVSAQYLAKNLNARGSHHKDLSILLGIQNIRKFDVNKSKRLDLNSILGEDEKNLNKSRKRIW